MHFQSALEELWSQHVRNGRGLCWNYVTLTNRILTSPNQLINYDGRQLHLKKI